MLGAEYGEIVPSYRETGRETSCPSQPACALLRAGTALSTRWGFAQRVMVRISQTITETARRDSQPVTLSSLLEVEDQLLET